ncbi:unnamed protein product [Prunus armeniaca]|uniref:Uncharacterized protein n=1 Tax=Prunus armeniaca TaxID=36596 RepID=A0A6J5WXR0_PRUAR|nr:unnamed protein product [Prunus armeniaca]
MIKFETVEKGLMGQFIAGLSELEMESLCQIMVVGFTQLPAKPKIDTQSGDSKGRGSESLRGLEDVDGGGRAGKLSRLERILRENGESCAYHVTFKRKIR